MFMAHYHEPDTALALTGIQILTAQELKYFMHDNQHVLWIIETCERIKRNNEDKATGWEMPGMLYGMIVSAFDKALEDYTKWLAINDPDILRQTTEPEDVYAWLRAACEDMFLKEGDALEFVTVGDVMRIFTEVLTEKHMVTMIEIIDMPFASRLIELAMVSKRRDTLARLRASIKSNFEQFVEDYAKTHSK
jgi:hypothetical protein